MAGHGPPPNPFARRVKGNRGTFLPAEGRSGPVPEWPLGGGSERELAMWKDLWHLPVAVQWEKYGWFHEVAMYCRWMLKAEQLNEAAAREARMLSDRLGLNPAAAQRYGWVVEARDPAPVSLLSQSAGSARQRVQAVDPDGDNAV